VWAFAAESATACPARPRAAFGVLVLHGGYLGDDLAAGPAGASDTIPGVGSDMYLMSSPR